MEVLRRVPVKLDFNPRIEPNGMVCAAADNEPAHFSLVVKRFSSRCLENPDNYIMTPMAPVMIQAAKRNYPAHIAVPRIHGVKELAGKAKGMTMIICGAGRSLVDVVSQIPPKDSVDHSGLVVVAINGALKALDPSQVDFFFALDWSAKPEWWSGYDTNDIPAVLGLTVPPHFINGFKTRYYFASNLFGVDPKAYREWEQKIGQLEASKCATYSLMHLAYQMGVTKIIFVGHDFAVTDGWYYWNERLSFSYAQAQEMVIAQDMWGNATCTGPIMMRNCSVVATSCKFCTLDGIACLNASEKGILALEDYCMPFADALAWGAKPKGAPVEENGHSKQEEFLVQPRPTPVTVR